LIDWQAALASAQLPEDLDAIKAHRRAVKIALRHAGLPDNLLSAVETRALRSGRRQTGLFQSNRASRWNLNPQDPQFGTERDCNIIVLRLWGMILAFDNAPAIGNEAREILERHYLGVALQAGTYRDSLLLESLDYQQVLAEIENPIHGVSQLHLGHQDPTIHPKHVPQNILWRSHRSNLIQGNMTLRQARIYIVKLIGRYFELGELNIE
jgi:hypothetical protein